MHPRACACPNCTGRVQSTGVDTVLETVLAVGVLAGVVLARFVTGRVLFRPVGPWDATYQSWAPLVPDEVIRVRGGGYPRSSWARRPGYQRQVVRLLAVLVLVGGIVAPMLTAAAVGGAVLAGAGVAFALTRGRSAPRPERVAPEPQYSTYVRTAHRMAVPPYANPYLQATYVQNPYVSTYPETAQDKPARVRASAVRLDDTTSRDGRW